MVKYECACNFHRFAVVESVDRFPRIVSVSYLLSNCTSCEFFIDFKYFDIHCNILSGIDRLRRAFPTSRARNAVKHNSEVYIAVTHIRFIYETRQMRLLMTWNWNNGSAIVTMILNFLFARADVTKSCFLSCARVPTEVRFLRCDQPYRAIPVSRLIAHYPRDYGVAILRLSELLVSFLRHFVPQ